MTHLINNNAQTTLAGAISNTALTASLSPGSGVLFPAPSGGNDFYMTFVDAATGLINEIVKVTNVTGDVITMQRGQDGTTAKTWLAGDIAANFITAGYLNAEVQQSDLQSNKFLSATDTGTANSYIISHTPAITALTDMMVLEFTVLHTNTGASTITIDANTSIPLIGGAQSALQGGELLVGGKATVIYSASLASAILVGCTGAPMQVAPAAKTGHALQLGQFLSTLSANGYVEIPTTAGVLIVQWGAATAPASGVSASSVAVTFPTPFATACYVVTGSAIGKANSGTGGTPSFGSGSITSSGYVATLDALGYTTFNQTCLLSWIAVGK